jgi:hypothetical protein
MVPLYPDMLSLKNARRSVSRVLFPPRRAFDGHSSGTSVTERLARPTRATARKLAFRSRSSGAPPLSGLAPGGVYNAAPVAGSAVRSYRPFSPLPAAAEALAGGSLSVALSLGLPPPDVIRHRASVEPGLSSPRHGCPCRKATIRPSGTSFINRSVD